VAPTSPLIVNAVADGSPASSVIQRGDEILSVEGVTPPNASNLLGPSIIDAVASQLPGTPLALLIKRDGQQMVVHMTASSYENPARANTSTPEAGYLGIEMTTDSPAVSQSDGLGTDRGAVIVSTPSNSPAANAGLVSGDVITSINGTQVSGTTDVSLALASVTAADSVSIDYVDLNGASHTVNVQLSSYPQSNSTFPPTVYAL
jgi:serine protease Do